MKKVTPYRFLFAGGGTGGHLYPAIAVANEIKKIKPESEIIFVGTKSRIEGKVVPKLGYGFKSIWIKGFARKFNFENFLFPLKLFVSLIQSVVISFRFKPKVAIGSGGYVAGPAIWGASVLGAKIILMESNSYPGITTRLLERYADELHVAFEDSKKYLRRPEKVKVTGNPVRTELGSTKKEE
ncbi:MAG: undecaprenyldiphospho-muramoylpentapeptide beta-N-acetylglucosaminyltransferase, partial [Ignavibacterium sp.]